MAQWSVQWRQRRERHFSFLAQEKTGQHKRRTRTMISTYLLTWKLFWASWNKDCTMQQRTIAQLGTHFIRHDSPMETALILNVITFTLLQAGLIYLADFSADFRLFCLFWVHLPCLFGSVAFYYYKYGATRCFKRLTFSSLLIWLKNWIAMQGIALVCLTQTTAFYIFGHLIQPYVLPKSWQFSVRFPMKCTRNTSKYVSIFSLDYLLYVW